MKVITDLHVSPENGQLRITITKQELKLDDEGHLIGLGGEEIYVTVIDGGIKMQFS